MYLVCVFVVLISSQVLMAQDRQLIDNSQITKKVYKHQQYTPLYNVAEYYPYYADLGYPRYAIDTGFVGPAPINDPYFRSINCPNGICAVSRRNGFNNDIKANFVGDVKQNVNMNEQAVNEVNLRSINCPNGICEVTRGSRFDNHLEAKNNGHINQYAPINEVNMRSISYCPNGMCKISRRNGFNNDIKGNYLGDVQQNVNMNEQAPTNEEYLRSVNCPNGICSYRPSPVSRGNDFNNHIKANFVGDVKQNVNMNEQAVNEVNLRPNNCPNGICTYLPPPVSRRNGFKNDVHANYYGDVNQNMNVEMPRKN